MGRWGRRAVRGLQPSFSRGEISPDLHARVDLSFYATGLARLENFIVLPRGGVTRRTGFERLGTALAQNAGSSPRLIPFIYSSGDALMIELGHMSARIWRPSTGQPIAQIPSPYQAEDTAGIKYAQSGNEMFLTHSNHPVRRLRRKALAQWEFVAFDYRRGPWLPDVGAADVKMTLQTVGGGGYRVNASAPYFTQNMAGRLLQVTFIIQSRRVDGVTGGGGYSSSHIEVGAMWYFRTYDSWTGTIEVQKSLDSGLNWISVRQYTRTNTDEQPNVEWSGSEAEENVIYRVTSPSAGIRFSIEATGYSRSYVLRLLSFISAVAFSAREEREPGQTSSPMIDIPSSGWRLGAWGGSDGYPSCAAFYQERLVLAGSPGQPQSIWFSKINSYADFGVSDPVRDDDPISITLTGVGADAIHSLLAMSDVIAFTGSGEWKISGSGQNGAISPSAVVAHQQSEIGSYPEQPLLVGGKAVMAQAHRLSAHALQYLFEYDGYRGSDLSILSNHLTGNKTGEAGRPPDRRLKHMAYQKIPNSVVWFSLEDGSALSLTIQDEHGVAAWARHSTDGFIGSIACVPGGRETELWAAVRRGGAWGIERLASAIDELCFHDPGGLYESVLETLRVNMDSQGGSLMAAKKFIPRVTLYAIRSADAWAAPKTDRDGAKRRRVALEWSADMTEADLQLDSGFEKNAGVRIWAGGDGPLTLLAISPVIAPGA
jgi:hypothetical protein